MTSLELLFLASLSVAGVMRSASVSPPISDVVDNMECAAMQVRPFELTGDIPNSDVVIFTARSCPLDYPLNDTRLKCEQNETYTELDDVVPVLHIPTGIVYRNKYCTECNGLDNETLSHWSVHISCVGDYYWPQDFEGMVSDVQESAGCNILFQYLSDVPVNLPPTCSLGELLFCDLKMKSVCSADHSKINGISCFWIKDQASVDDCATLGDIVDTTEATFSLALRYELAGMPDAILTDSPPDPTCKDGTYHDELKNVCRVLKCGEMRKLEGGICHSIVEEISGATVKFALMMTPEDQLQNLSADIFSDISDEVLKYGVNLLNKYLLDDYSRITLLYSAKINEDIGTTLDVVYYVLYFRVSIHYSMSVKTDVFDEILFSHGTSESIALGSNTFFLEFITIKIETDANNDKLYYNEHLNDLLQVYDTHRGSSFVSLHDPNRYTLLSTSGPCPLVRLSVDEFGIQNFTYFITIPDLFVIIGKWDIIEVIGLDGRLDSVLLCVDLYESIIWSHLYPNTLSVTHPSTTATSSPSVSAKLSSTSLTLRTDGLPKLSTHSPSVSSELTTVFTNTAVSSEETQGQYHLSSTHNPPGSEQMSRTRISPDLFILVCSCLSIFCLIMTVLTYCMFRELRALNCTNDILLCIFLIFAQAFLSFTFVMHDEINDDFTSFPLERVTECKTVGGFTQLFWLIASAWLNACCFHSMNLSITDNRNKFRCTCIYILYIVLIALVPSIIGIVNTAASDINTSHFKKLQCFIFEKSIMWWAFVLPISCTLMVAFVFYLSNQFRLTKSNNETRLIIYKYVCMSALIGCVWVFGTAYMSSGHLFFKIVFGMFNVALGFCVLLLLIGNRLCVSLYRAHIRNSVSLSTHNSRHASTVHVQIATEKV